jgi:transcriptional regulator with XRE-family HTH domain
VGKDYYLTSNTESLQIRLVIKDLLKKNGLQQKDLAQALDISIPSVKRILNGRELGLERLIQIAHFFRLNVFELFDLCRQKNIESYQFDEAQEKFLADDLIHLVTFRGLVSGVSSNEIRTRYRLTDSQLEKILIGLDRVNLVEFWSHEKIKVKAKWPFKWITGGILQKTYVYSFLEKTFTASYQRSQFGPKGRALENLFLPFELRLRDSTYEQLHKDLAQVLQNYRSISKFEMMTSDPESLRDATGLIIVDSFSAWDKLLSEV